jgi:hypothetical protein
LLLLFRKKLSPRPEQSPVVAQVMAGVLARLLPGVLARLLPDVLARMVLSGVDRSYQQDTHNERATTHIEPFHENFLQ